MISEFRSVNQIARSVGMKNETISKYLDHIGIPRPKRPNACRKNHDLVVKMAIEMRSLKEIARTIGTNDRRVRQYLDSVGVVREYPLGSSGQNNPNWKGGRLVDKSGYILLKAVGHPDANHWGYIREHRLVMEQMIGRRLLPLEVVHHRNGIKDDNRPKNLQLFSENGAHLAHDLKGKCPKWSQEGYENIQKAVAQWRASRRKNNRSQSEHGVSQLR